jgi:hypothetical protein
MLFSLVGFSGAAPTCAHLQRTCTKPEKGEHDQHHHSVESKVMSTEQLERSRFDGKERRGDRLRPTLNSRDVRSKVRSRGQLSRPAATLILTATFLTWKHKHFGRETLMTRIRALGRRIRLLGDFAEGTRSSGWDEREIKRGHKRFGVQDGDLG